MKIRTSVARSLCALSHKRNVGSDLLFVDGASCIVAGSRITGEIVDDQQEQGYARMLVDGVADAAKATPAQHLDVSSTDGVNRVAYTDKKERTAEIRQANGDVYDRPDTCVGARQLYPRIDDVSHLHVALDLRTLQLLIDTAGKGDYVLLAIPLYYDEDAGRFHGQAGARQAAGENLTLTSPVAYSVPIGDGLQLRGVFATVDCSLPTDANP